MVLSRHRRERRGEFEGDSGGRTGWILCRHGGWGVRKPPGSQPGSPGDRCCAGGAPRSALLLQGLHSPPLPICNFPCLEFSSSPSGHPGRESAGKKIPTPAAGPQGRGCPGLTLFLFLQGARARASGNPGGRTGGLSHGDLSSRALGDSGVRKPRSAAMGWGMRVCIIWTRVCVLSQACVWHAGACVCVSLCVSSFFPHVPLTAGNAATTEPDLNPLPAPISLPLAPSPPFSLCSDGPSSGTLPPALPLSKIISLKIISRFTYVDLPPAFGC